MYIIHNGKIVTEQTILEGFVVVVEGELIRAIIPKEQIGDYPEARLIDARGGYISPGFIDIHSDYIETIASPRPTSMMDFDISLREAEKILISHGITTMFHSLSFYKEDVFSHKPMRNPTNIQRMVDAIETTHNRLHLIRHRLHARFEIDNIDEVDQLVKNIEDGKVHLLSFMDHTPGQGQYRNLEVYRETLKGYRDISDEDVNVLIAERQSMECLTTQKIKEVADIARAHGIAVASHDDDDIKKLDLVKSFGTTISEFPITLEVAAKAKELGIHTIAGAPNVMLGGSHSGNLSAAEAISQGCMDILCSDYYPPALLHAVFDLHEKYGNNLHEMFMMVTLNPAKAVKMDDELGSIKVGKRADLLVIERMDDGYPMLTTTMVNGVLITTTNYRIK
ncbi:MULTISPECIES: phosphonate metabolism protein PhnM [Planococcus]|uniref:Alpha-D-ribose 1-methylphosphonate 5-triphosphate diphosphatase n=1 Tax=Planococcus faecalis TaxID=1598147 RepID=A0ABN4XPQ2_9BACL|nr:MULTISPECIES: phosphonate metabolism protein PhnM [Planococcus]AQU80781.1 alpha-D-ribose 1-methylphosphonate 5-triphosphate diphosphatase [Planococcus faecalis]MDJ0331999.1 phosphonate metabolism protein PhnM [Planococcus sp. S3-L1]OHX55767.1 alpha-D-ribose 1-methylphosphonate 5-triphosphate diphosphatase [Planococcus faecalis]